MKDEVLDVGEALSCQSFLEIPVPGEKEKTADFVTDIEKETAPIVSDSIVIEEVISAISHNVIEEEAKAVKTGEIRERVDDSPPIAESEDGVKEIDAKSTEEEAGLEAKETTVGKTPDLKKKHRKRK
jgi:hypothetical protein